MFWIIYQTKLKTELCSSLSDVRICNSSVILWQNEYIWVLDCLVRPNKAFEDANVIFGKLCQTW